MIEPPANFFALGPVDVHFSTQSDVWLDKLITSCGAWD